LLPDAPIRVPRGRERWLCGQWFVVHGNVRTRSTHGIRNEIVEEFAKKKEMCHLKGKKTRPFPVIRRHYE
jgi:hypothetical protein